MSIIIGIDHGYYAIKTAHCSFPAGLTSYGEHEPYTRQGLLEFGGCFFVCGSGRQPIQRDKTVNDNYYLLTLAAIAKEILQRGLPPECSVRIAAGLPLTSFGRDKPKFKDYLLRSKQPVNFRFEGVEYSITIVNVRKRYSEFLGFKIRVFRKGEKYVVRSHICDKKLQLEERKLVEQAKHIANPTEGKSQPAEIGLFDEMVLGIQNYYKIATCISLDHLPS